MNAHCSVLMHLHVWILQYYHFKNEQLPALYFFPSLDLFANITAAVTYHNQIMSDAYFLVTKTYLPETFQDL